MRKNLLPLMGIAFVVALAATGIFYGLFVGKISGAAPAAPQRIVVAARDLQPGMLLQPEDLRSQSWTAPLPDGVILSAPDAAGRSLAEPVRAGEPVVQNKLTAAPRASTGLIPSGMRGISLRIMDSSGLFPSLRPGMKVDLQVVQMQTGAGPSARTVLENVTFLGLQGEPPQPGALAVVNLLVTPEDADRLALAEAAARIRLLLRNQSEPSASPRPAAVLAGLLKSPAPLPQNHNPAPALPAAGPPVPPKLALHLSLHWLPEDALSASARGVGFQIVHPGAPIAARLAESNSRASLPSRSLTSGARPELLLEAKSNPTEQSGFLLRAHAQATHTGARLLLDPEITVPIPGGWSTIHLPQSLLVRHGDAVLLTGLDDDAAYPGLAAKLPLPATRPPASRLALVIAAGAAPGQPQIAAALPGASR
jgi:pilus assembly protein CpaB